MHDRDHQKAFTMIQEKDRESEILARNLYSVDWQEPSLYDIIFNLNNVRVENAVELLVHMSMQNNFTPSPSARREHEDLFLGCLVWAELIKSPLTCHSNIMVTANGGRVAVHGHARSEEIIREIPIIANQIDGVKKVICMMDMDPE